MYKMVNHKSLSSADVTYMKKVSLLCITTLFFGILINVGIKILFANVQQCNIILKRMNLDV